MLNPIILVFAFATLFYLAILAARSIRKHAVHRQFLEGERLAARTEAFAKRTAIRHITDLLADPFKLLARAAHADKYSQIIDRDEQTALATLSVSLSGHRDSVNQHLQQANFAAGGQAESPNLSTKQYFTMTEHYADAHDFAQKALSDFNQIGFIYFNLTRKYILNSELPKIPPQITKAKIALLSTLNSPDTLSVNDYKKAKILLSQATFLHQKALVLRAQKTYDQATTVMHSATTALTEAQALIATIASRSQ